MQPESPDPSGEAYQREVERPGIKSPTLPPLDVGRLARARHRGLHPTYPTFSRCHCDRWAQTFAEWDRMARASDD